MARKSKSQGSGKQESKKSRLTDAATAAPSIDVKALVDDITNEKMDKSELSDLQKRAILDSRHAQENLSGYDYARSKIKEEVSDGADWLDAPDRNASAGATVKAIFPIVVKHANAGNLSSIGHLNTFKAKKKRAFQDLFTARRDDIHSTADLNKYHEFAAYIVDHGPEVLRDWINEVAPRHLRRGRPRKQN